MIRIFIVADSTDHADAVAAQLEEDERFEISDIGQADVILCVGISLRRLPMRGKPIVAVSGDSDGDAPFDEILRSWLPVGATLEEIVAALTAAASGFTVLTRQQAKRTFRIPRPIDAEVLDAEPLTPRELEVLQMMAAGLGNKEIALKLSISPNTAKFHVAQILAKLGANSRTEAVSLAIRRGALAI